MTYLDVCGPERRPCRTCANRFPVTLDYWPRDPAGRDGIRPHCISCYNARRRQAYAADPEPQRRRMRERYAARAEHFRRALTPDEQGPLSYPKTKD